MGRCDFPPYYISAYGLAVRQGFLGTLEEWLESLHGTPGDSVELRCNEGQVQWRTVTHAGEPGEWITLYTVGQDGVDPETMERILREYLETSGVLEERVLEYLFQNGVPGETLETLVQEYFRENPVADGVTFIPSVDADGNLSWTNNGNLPNPEPVNIKGPKGDPGEGGGAGGALTEEDKADLVDRVLEELPVSVDDAGFTDISGLRRATGYAFVRSGQSIALTVALEGGVSEVHSIALDTDDWPVTVTTNGHAAPVTWEGF